MTYLVKNEKAKKVSKFCSNADRCIQVCALDWVTAESFVNGVLSGSYSVLSIRQATVNKQDLFYKFWLFHSLPSKSQDNHITITQRQAQTCKFVWFDLFWKLDLCVCSRT